VRQEGVPEIQLPENGRFAEDELGGWQWIFIFDKKVLGSSLLME